MEIGLVTRFFRRVQENRNKRGCHYVVLLYTEGGRADSNRASVLRHLVGFTNKSRLLGFTAKS